jgi:hypothetical protein
LKIKGLLYRFALSFQLKSMAILFRFLIFSNSSFDVGRSRVRRSLVSSTIKLAAIQASGGVDN